MLTVTNASIHVANKHAVTGSFVRHDGMQDAYRSDGTHEQQTGRGTHPWASQILGYRFELIHRVAGARALRIEHMIQAMIQMIVDEGILRFTHSPLRRLQLLGDIQARPSCLDHLLNATQLTLGALESFQNITMNWDRIR